MSAPAAGFSIYAGTSADFMAAIVVATSGLDIVTVPGTPPTPVSVLEGMKYSFRDSVTGAEFVGFGSGGDSLGVLGKIKLRGGISDWSVTLDAANNGNSGSGLSTWSRLKRGTYVYFHVILEKVSGYGFRGCFGKVKSNNGSADVKSQEASPISIEIEGIGLIPDPTFAP